MLGDSQFWASLMKVKTVFLSLHKFDLGEGVSSTILEGFVDKISLAEITLPNTL